MHIHISIAAQTLTLLNADNELLAQFPVSTAANGVGCDKNSGCTPLGAHVIRAKIGGDAPPSAVFVGRRQTGEICTSALMDAFPDRDWILTRILWLSGKEVGKNRLGNVDTMQRYVYIHGTPDSTDITVIGSHGCVRMRNADIMTLFNMVPTGVAVQIDND